MAIRKVKGSTFLDPGYVYAPYIPPQVGPAISELMNKVFSYEQSIYAIYPEEYFNPSEKLQAYCFLLGDMVQWLESVWVVVRAEKDEQYYELLNQDESEVCRVSKTILKIGGMVAKNVQILRREQNA